MPQRRFRFDSPDRFVTGTIGEPGNRVFFLQAREGTRVVSVVLEKVQVAALTQRLGELLEELERSGLADVLSGDAPQDVDPLDEPINETFRASTLSLGWDGDSDRILVEAQAEADVEIEVDVEAAEPGGTIADETDEEADSLRVLLTPLAVRTFIERAVRVLSAGRPPCPLCGQPLDPQGHLCPRRNGHLLN
jgi:uncharacterized repeat protein (TIGR03847 family)